MASLHPGLVLGAGGLLVALLPKGLRSLAFVGACAAALFVLLGLQEGTGPVLRFLGEEVAPLRVDRLSLLFGLVFGAIALLGGIFAFHVQDRLQQSAALFYAAGALGVVFAGDFLTLFVCWELMAVASVNLVLARRTPEAYRAAIRYFFVHLVGGGILLAGIVLHATQTGSLLFERLAESPGAWLILVGFAINTAIPPLHAWLADAYPEGTITGSVFMSALTTKTAVYALARGFAGWDLLVPLGVAMALYGVVYAVLVNDIRRILAYHIVSQVGFMVAGIGIGTEAALNGATAHAFTHILYKALLFMGAGAVLYATGKSKLSELGGLARAMPLVLCLYMVGACSISGFPLFSGYVSKPMTVDAAGAAGLGWVVMLLNLASVGTFLHTGLKLPWFTWFGPARRLEARPVPRGMVVAMGITAAINIAIGVQPSLLFSILPFPVDFEPYTAAHLIKSCQLLGFTGLCFWLLTGKLGGEPVLVLDTDWFYRRPARAVLRAVGWVDAAFAGAQRVTDALVHSLARLAADPAGRASSALRGLVDRSRSSAEGRPGGGAWAMPLGAALLVVLALSIALLSRFLTAV